MALLKLNKDKDKKVKSSEERKRESIDKQKSRILKNNSVGVQIPYVKSGVNDALVGSAAFGKNGAVLGSFSEGSVGWKNVRLNFIEDGFSIKDTGDVIFYKDIERLVIADRGWVHSVLTIVLVNDVNFPIRSVLDIIDALKEIIESRLPQKKLLEDNTNIGDVSISVADELLKYGELLEKGLITREEFDLFKEKFINMDENDYENVVEDSDTVFCTNCGEMLKSDSKFCMYCGFKL